MPNPAPSPAAVCSEAMLTAWGRYKLTCAGRGRVVLPDAQLLPLGAPLGLPQSERPLGHHLHAPIHQLRIQGTR